MESSILIVFITFDGRISRVLLVPTEFVFVCYFACYLRWKTEFIVSTYEIAGAGFDASFNLICEFG